MTSDFRERLCVEECMAGEFLLPCWMMAARVRNQQRTSVNLISRITAQVLSLKRICHISAKGKGIKISLPATKGCHWLCVPKVSVVTTWVTGMHNRMNSGAIIQHVKLKKTPYYGSYLSCNRGSGCFCIRTGQFLTRI